MIRRELPLGFQSYSCIGLFLLCVSVRACLFYTKETRIQLCDLISPPVIVTSIFVVSHILYSIFHNLTSISLYNYKLFNLHSIKEY